MCEEQSSPTSSDLYVREGAVFVPVSSLSLLWFCGAWEKETMEECVCGQKTKTKITVIINLLIKSNYYVTN